MTNLEIDLSKIKINSQEFEALVFDCVNDRSWCAFNKINYVDPNFSEVKEKLYQELLYYNEEIN